MPSNIFTNDLRLTSPHWREYGSPFSTYARALYPTTLEEVFNWSEYMFLHQGVYAKAIQRAVRYFITQIEVTGTRDYKIRRKYADYLQDKLGILNVLGLVGDDLMAYGNCFVSVFKPFHRNLVCEHCGLYRPADTVEYNFSNFQFVATCTKCRKKGPQKVVDVPTATDELRVTRWNPRSIEIEYHAMSGEKRYFYEPHAKVKGAINRGERVAVENTPMEMLESLRNNQKFLFHKSEIYHMAIGVPASFTDDTAGWGLPPFLANFEQVVELQMLTRFNEAIMMDYLIPMRLFSPGSRGGEAGDPLINIDSGRFMRSIENMVRQHRRDPTSYHSVPYPVNYQAIGGEAKQMAPVDMLEYALGSLLSSMGIPQELYKESLGAGGPPIGLRMFERSWTGFQSELNRFLDWVTSKCVEHLMWEDVRVRLVKTSIYEDDEVRQTKLNLLGANKVSNTTAFLAFNIDYEYEVDKILEEQAMFDEKVAEMQKNQQDAQQNIQTMAAPAGAPGPGGAPGGAPAPGPGGPPQGGGGPPSPGGGGGTLEDMDQQADQTAQQIIAMPSGQRRSQLLNLKKTNDALHALVVSKIQAYENQAGQTGVNMTRQGQIPVGQQQQ